MKSNFITFIPFRVADRKFADIYEAEEHARAESVILRQSVEVFRGTATVCQWTEGRKNWQNPEICSQFPVAKGVAA